MRRREFIGSLIGTAVAWPLAASAQQPAKVYRIAIVHPSTPIKWMSDGTYSPGLKALLGELRRIGYIEGQNLIVERYSAEGRTAHYAELASEVVRQQPDAIFTVTSRMIRNFKAATDTIPIIGLMADPIAFGLVSSLSRPGGNITGFTQDAGLEVWGKRLGLFRELIPTASRVGFLASRDVAGTPEDVAIREAAQQAGISIVGPVLEGTIQESEYRRVFKVMTQERADALIVSDQGEHGTYRQLIIELAEASRLPALFPYRFWAEQGGLIAYGIDVIDQYRRAAGYIARILQGAKSSELPIDQATKFELAINLKTAKALGLTVPQILLVIASAYNAAFAHWLIVGGSHEASRIYWQPDWHGGRVAARSVGAGE
jgi:putative ABC transport system substrate-binding protein